jgi:cell fate (sporulation/competence/biofilm development) regulator YlbF (YheA/YmcA/DUF963 family)
MMQIEQIYKDNICFGDDHLKAISRAVDEINSEWQCFTTIEQLHKAKQDFTEYLTKKRG